MAKSIFSIVGLVVAGGVFFLYAQPRYDDIRTLNTQIGQYDQALEKAAELQHRKQELLTRYNAFDPSNVERLHKLLPDHVDNVRLVLDLDNLAVLHGMALQNVVISDVPSEKSAKGVVGAGLGNRQKFDSLTLKFRTQGAYSDFTAFLRDLEASLRIVDLVSLKLQQEASSPSKVPTEPMYRYDITIRTYWLKQPV